MKKIAGLLRESESNMKDLIRESESNMQSNMKDLIRESESNKGFIKNLKR